VRVQLGATTDEQGRFTVRGVTPGTTGEVWVYHESKIRPSRARTVLAFEAPTLDPIELPDLVVPADQLAPAGAPAVAVAVHKHLVNTSIEDGTGIAPADWWPGAKIEGVEYLWSRDAGHTGTSSLCLKKTARRYFPIAQWLQPIERTGDAPRLRVSAWVKADHVTKAILDAQFVDEKGAWSHAWVVYIGPKDPDGTPFTHDWKQYQGVVTIPPGTKQILIAPQIYGPGTVWFDDLDATYTSDPATDPLAS
jgi:RNA polymerase sigma-70 factor (ECF subfamily)